jgi:hypothetical protein
MLNGSSADLERILNDGDLRRKVAQLLVAHPPEFLDRRVLFYVDGGADVPRLIRSYHCHSYGWEPSSFFLRWGPSSATPSGEKEAFLLHYGREMTNKEVLDDMRRQSI